MKAPQFLNIVYILIGILSSGNMEIRFLLFHIIKGEAPAILEYACRCDSEMIKLFTKG